MYLPRSRRRFVGALAADRHDLDRLAGRYQLVGVGTRKLGDVRVEPAAQPALGRHDDEQVDLIAPRTDKQRGCAVLGRRLVEVGQHRIHTPSVGTRRLGGLLRTAQLGSGHHLHGLGDLARRLHRGNSCAQVF